MLSCPRCQGLIVALEEEGIAGVRCVNCGAREYAPQVVRSARWLAELAERKALQAAYQRSRMRMGKCSSCGRTAPAGRTRCYLHAAYDKRRTVLNGVRHAFSIYD